MLLLDKALRAWGTANFETALKQEVAQLNADQLLLQQGLSTGNYVAADPITVAINSVADMGDIIRVTVGIFYKSVLGGCNCADDPTPTSENNEYCEVQLDINKTTSATTVALVTE